MSSINNWLGFSLSPQELQDQQHPNHQSLGFNSDEISNTQISNESCFDSAVPSLNLPAPHFGILEAFNGNPHSQDWNMNDMNMNTFSCSSQNLEDENRPKLENFLGVNHQEHKYQLTMYQDSEASASNNGNNDLPMITNWLTNSPAPPHAAESSEAAAPAAAAQTLSLSMSTGSQSSSPLPNDAKLGNAAAEGGAAIESVPRRSIDTFGQRTSIYRGVTRHRWTGRYEAHLWDNSCRREGQSRKGRQGGYDKEDKAARAYDLAALKYWGTTTTTNFPISNYEKEIEDMKNMTRQEFVASIRRKSSGFSRGASIYRGVTRHHQHGRWQARIGRVAGNKDLYLGTFSTEEEAAEAYDIAAIKFRGLNAVTNFEINRYDVKSILESSTLPIRGAAKRLKDAENAEMALDLHRASEANLSLHLTEGQMSGFGSSSSNAHGWPNVAFQQAQPLSMYPYGHQMLWCKQEHDPYVGHAYNEINHQLQLGINAQNFLQPSALHNIMGLDSSNIEHSSGSNSALYGNSGGGDGTVVPTMGAMVVQDGNQSLDYESMFGSADTYQQARNLYYQSQQSSSNLAKATNNLYDQGSASTNWIPTAVPTGSASARANNAAENQGASTFTVWNDT
ncbi:hypothetical protein AAHA92_13016 [Salvia divinorum]|uniref:AP2/ERF domain-containing protein n=1 Tax=Salvia divinorum TaxID=28513 RepID=A0ABD1H6Y7_SALDI